MVGTRFRGSQQLGQLRHIRRNASRLLSGESWLRSPSLLVVEKEVDEDCPIVIAHDDKASVFSADHGAGSGGVVVWIVGRLRMVSEAGMRGHGVSTGNRAEPISNRSFGIAGTFQVMHHLASDSRRIITRVFPLVGKTRLPLQVYSDRNDRDL
jgi:hypothetical protein